MGPVSDRPSAGNRQVMVIHLNRNNSGLGLVVVPADLISVKYSLQGQR
jgi:hypothetical protein